MDLVLITILCISFSIMLTPSNGSLQIQPQSSQDQVPDHRTRLSLTTLPRKLRLIQETTVKGYEGKDFVSHNRQNGVFSGTKQHKDEEKIDTKRGTWQEWKERADMSQYFTMDYTHVRRRRPIHNKSVPIVAP